MFFSQKVADDMGYQVSLPRLTHESSTHRPFKLSNIPEVDGSGGSSFLLGPFLVVTFQGLLLAVYKTSGGVFSFPWLQPR